MKKHFRKGPLEPRSQWQLSATIIAVGLLGVGACTPVEPPEDPAVGDSGDEVAGEVMLVDIASPVGGTVKQLSLPGPQSAVLIACSQDGFTPFTFTDSGLDWIGCQVPNPGDPAGAESTLAEPVLEIVESPVGGSVPQVTLPGPQSAVAIACEGDFKPFLYQDQGNWIGCQAP